jgi:hypothetical protein
LERFAQQLFELLEVRRFARPYDDPLPAEFRKVGCVLGISPNIAVQLPVPVPFIAFWSAAPATLLAVVSMPETAMDENDSPPLGEDNVGLPRQILAMKAETAAHPMQSPPDSQFRLRVLVSDQAHDLGPTLFREHVHHDWPCI